MRPRPTPIALLLALAATAILFALPASATPPIGQPDNGFSKLDERYLHVYKDCWEAFGADCGRNRVDDGNEDGTSPTDAQVAASTQRMEAWLNPPEPVAEPVTESVAPAPVETSVAPTSVGVPVDINCESGGDYSINTGNGYYGAYQFDSSTWDAYGDPAYGEANEAPPAVQDAAAASVPYDAWPNC